jgi:hypothetical protein
MEVFDGRYHVALHSYHQGYKFSECPGLARLCNYVIQIFLLLGWETLTVNKGCRPSPHITISGGTTGAGHGSHGSAPIQLKSQEVEKC